MLTIKTAYQQDIELIRSLAMRVWPHTYADILSTDQIAYMLNLMYSASALQQQMNEGITFLIVYFNEDPVGFAAYGPVAPFVFKLHKLYVLPQQHRRGTGRYLMETVWSNIVSLNGQVLRLNVNRNNPARKFYEKIGFEIKGEENIDIGNGHYMNDYVMEKPVG